MTIMKSQFSGGTTRGSGHWDKARPATADGQVREAFLESLRQPVEGPLFTVLFVSLAVPSWALNTSLSKGMTMPLAKARLASNT